MCSAFAAFQAIKTSASSDNSAKPFLYEFFRIRPFYQMSAGTPEGTLHKIFNSMASALNNENYSLPKYITMIPDCDIILQINHYEPGVVFIIEEQLNWLFRKLERSLTSRQECLMKHFLGAVEETPTSFIWIKMIKRPLIRGHPFPYYNLVVKLGKKFNQIIQELCHKSRYSSALTPAYLLDNTNNFDNYGNLIFTGKTRYWKHLDTKLHEIHQAGKHADPSLPPMSQQQQEPQHHGKDTSTYSSGFKPSQFYHMGPRGDAHGNMERNKSPDIWGQAGRISRMEGCNPHNSSSR